MRRCVYCTQEKPASEFNVDHVVPRQLGSFHTNNLTLTCVCRDCNQYFGDDIERLFGRDSYEGLMRFVYGVRSPSEVRDFTGTRIELRLPEGSAWAGVRLRLAASADDARVVMDLPPQIGIKHPWESAFRFFLERELQAATDAELEIRAGSKFKLLASDEQASQRLHALIRQRVPTFRVEGRMAPPPVVNGELDVEIRATLDKALARAMAKIGFNYLAHVAGADFVLSDCFDEARLFIRYGRGERPQFVRPQNRPILTNESTRYRMTVGHIVVVEWHDQGTAIWARVSPFNAMTYGVILLVAMTSRLPAGSGQISCSPPNAHGSFPDRADRTRINTVDSVDRAGRRRGSRRRAAGRLRRRARRLMAGCAVRRRHSRP